MNDDNGIGVIACELSGTDEKPQMTLIVSDKRHGPFDIPEKYRHKPCPECGR
jgi:hypothetical protein